MPKIVPLLSVGVLCATLSACTLPSDGSGAADRITAHDSHIVVGGDGTIRVTETIDYDFGRDPSAGLLWEIPVSESDGFLRHRLMEFSDVEVSSPSGAPEGIEGRELDRGWLTLEIGDSDAPVTGVQSYAISYTVRGALTQEGEGVRLHWNVVGEGWGVPVQDVTARVEAPGIIGVDCAYLYEERVGDDVQEVEADCDRSGHDAESAGFAHESLRSDSPMSVVVDLAEGGVTVPEPEYGMAPLPRWITLVGVLCLMVAVVVAVGLLYLTLRVREVLRRGARKRLPEDPELSAAVAGYHWNKAELRAEHVLALLVSLEEKGHVVSEAGKKKAKDGSTNWVFTEGRSDVALSPAERALKRAMFERERRVGLGRLGRALSAFRVRWISRALNRECRARGLRTKAWILWPCTVLYLVALLAALFAPEFVNRLTPLEVSGLVAFSVGLVAIAAVFFWMPSPVTLLGERVRSRLAGSRSDPQGLDPVLGIALGLSDDNVERLAAAAPHTQPYYRDRRYRARWNRTVNGRIRAARRKGGSGGGGRVAGGGGGGSRGGRR